MIMKTTTTVSPTIRASVAPTGRIHPGAEFSAEPAPEYRLTERLPPCSGYFANGDVVQLDDGSYAYACAFPTDGTIGLYRYRVALDYGDNEIRRRTAPESCAGILAGDSRQMAGAYGRDLVGWLSEDSYEIAMGRRRGAA